MTAPKVLAFYLPQFHPTAPNDGWWVPGFTEWTNVARGKPLFSGHVQPHIPGELGYYDLRLPETRVAQAALAAEHGVDGFCYYHYWFGGRRMLDRVFDEVLETGSPDFPFCLLWANESWSRRWYDGANEMLMPQVYSQDDDVQHVGFLLKAFRDDRYIRVDGRPLFIVYRLHDHPNAAGFAALLRQRCAEAGLGDPYLVYSDVWDNDIASPAAVSFDASMGFPPHGIGRLTAAPDVRVAADGRTYTVFDYETAAQAFHTRLEREWTHHQCVVPMWDNTARRLDAGGSVLLTGGSPHAYERWLEAAIRKEAERGERGLVFVNAWNEWAEGAHLEPDLVHGRAYLEATRTAIERARGPVAPLDVGLPSAPTRIERTVQQLHNRLAAMHRAESDAFAAVDREVERRTASLRSQLDEALAGERRLINLLDAVLGTDRPSCLGMGGAVTGYLDTVALLVTEVDSGSTRDGLAVLVEAVERALGAGVAGDVVSIGAGSAGAVVVLRSALQAYDRTGRSAFGTEGGSDLVRASELLSRLGIADHRLQLLVDTAHVAALAPHLESVSVLRVGALDDSGDPLLKELIARMTPGGSVVVDRAGPEVVTTIDEAGRFRRFTRGGVRVPGVVTWRA